MTRSREANYMCQHLPWKEPYKLSNLDPPPRTHLPNWITQEPELKIL